MGRQMKRASRPSRGLSRRDAIRTAGAAGIAASIGPFFHILPAHAAQTLKILQWTHFVTGYDRWFTGYAKEWGRNNDTEVVVDTVNIGLLAGRAAAQAAAQKGHDLVMFLTPPSGYEEQTVDLAEVHAAWEKKHGKARDLAVRSSYNPRTKKYFAFCQSYVANPVTYRSDLWADAGVKPDSWDEIRAGARKIKDTTGIPCGIGLAAEPDSGLALRAILYSFGAQEQDAEGQPTINSPRTLAALKFLKALYQESMTPEVLTWSASANNAQMLGGRASLILNAISVTRAGEEGKLPIHQKIALAKAAKGPVRRVGPPSATHCYAIWKFAANIDGAKKFLIDLADNAKQAFLASAFYDLPAFPGAVADIRQIVAADARAMPADKYAALADAADWTVNLGYPGPCNAAIEEAFASGAISTMFAECATGAESPESALARCDAKMQAIWAKWRERKLI
jgi:multiple sugar transport system substrate-binding protein